VSTKHNNILNSFNLSNDKSLDQKVLKSMLEELIQISINSEDSGVSSDSEIKKLAQKFPDLFK
tara:strand:+ start:929 stop:1117 length:189 start_codon:yes stop_codon:yes gene_type:complete